MPDEKTPIHDKLVEDRKRQQEEKDKTREEIKNHWFGK